MRLLSLLLLFFTLSGYSQTLVPFEKNSQWGYYNINTQTTAIATSYQQAWPFKNGVAVVKKNNHYYTININNKVLSKLPYQYIRFNYGLADVAVKGKYGFIDYSGKIVIKPIYDEVSAFDEEGVSMVKIGEEIGEINREGKITKAFEIRDNFGMGLLMTDEYEEPTLVSPYQEGIALYSYKGYYGYADSSNNLIIPAKYYLGSELFIDGLSKVEYFTYSDKMKYYKDRLDDMFAPPLEDSVDAVSGKTIHRVRATQIFTHTGYIDKTGKEYFESDFSPNKFNYVEYWTGDKIKRVCYFVYDRLEGEYIEYDEQGNVLLKYTYKNGVRIE